MSSTRDCPSCGREAGFHLPSCGMDKPVDAAGLDDIKQKLTALHVECVAWGAKGLSRWALQLADDVGRALGTCRWLERDVETYRREREEQQKEKDHAPR